MVVLEGVIDDQTCAVANVAGIVGRKILLSVAGRRIDKHSTSNEGHQIDGAQDRASERTNRGRQEEGLGRRGMNILPPKDHQQITQIVLHVYFGIPRPLLTSLESKNDLLA